MVKGFCPCSDFVISFACDGFYGYDVEKVSSSRRRQQIRNSRRVHVRWCSSIAGGQCKVASVTGRLLQTACEISAFSHAPCRLRLASNMGGSGGGWAGSNVGGTGKRKFHVSGAEVPKATTCAIEADLVSFIHAPKQDNDPFVPIHHVPIQDNAPSVPVHHVPG
ncbi:hypothetical protein V6N11_066274 [Hibiscus sabdariffa]|uniref:Uncharacterized protein n=2 Tax=Hibiscus sabdariffa TaxID=183260 RepID=A0ABR1ZLA0_9ROSI